MMQLKKANQDYDGLLKKINGKKKPKITIVVRYFWLLFLGNHRFRDRYRFK